MSGPARRGYAQMTFRPDDDESVVVALKPESDITWQPGLKPQVWSFIVSYLEIKKLNGKVGLTGSLCLHDIHDPSTGGDVIFRKVRIVDCEPRGLAMLPNVKKNNVPGPIWSEYRICIADFRDQFVSPRGGRVTLGIINPPPAEKVQKGKKEKTGDELEMTYSEMLIACLLAMGLADVPLPAGADKVEAPRDVKWLGNHAPTELEKLLKRGRYVFCPTVDGKAKIAAIGEGDLPAFGAELVSDAAAPAVDRRGKTCIITSYPTRVTETLNLKGPFADWNFCVLDSDNQWRINTLLKCCQGLMEDQVRNGFQGITPAKIKDRVAAQAYRHIMIERDLVEDGTAAALTRVINKGGKTSQPELLATIAQRRPSGFRMSDADVSVPVAFLRGGSIVQLSQMVGKVDTPNVDPWEPHFRELDPGSATLVITIEKTKPNTKGAKKPAALPVFFEAGYTKDTNGVVELSEAETENALDGSGDDVIVVCRPELALRYVDGAADNLTDLKAKAKAIATDLLKDSGASVQHFIARGWQKAQLSGRVSKITWAVGNYWTDCEVDAWWAPGGALDPELYRERQEEAYPEQDKTAASRAADGASGDRPPVISLGNGQYPIPVPPGMFMVLCTVDGGEAGGPGTGGAPATNCSFTYKLETIQGVAIDKAIKRVPTCKRFDAVEYLRPADRSYGIGYLDQEGATKLYHVSTEIPKTDTITVITAARADSTNGLQIKTRECVVLEAKDESDWQTLSEGTDCP